MLTDISGAEVVTSNFGRKCNAGTLDFLLTYRARAWEIRKAPFAAKAGDP